MSGIIPRYLGFKDGCKMVTIIKEHNGIGETGMPKALGTQNMEQEILSGKEDGFVMKEHLNLVGKNEYDFAK